MTLTSPDPDAIRETLKTAARLEREWTGKIPDTDKSRCPWMPYSIPDFIALLAEALPAAPGNRFLDAGAGIGTKMMLAAGIFGLDVTGIEIVPEYAAEAGRHGLDVRIGDAADFGDYGEYGLIWLYRPFRDPDLQAALEKVVWDDMAPGAVTVCAGLEEPPPSSRFHVILDDWEARRGIYLKAPAG